MRTVVGIRSGTSASACDPTQNLAPTIRFASRRQLAEVLSDENRALLPIDGQLRAQQWFDASKEGKRHRYGPIQKRGEYTRYFDRYFSGTGAAFDKILGAFKTLDTERCEIVATLLAAWSDLPRDKGTISDELVVHEVLNNGHEAKRRISEDRWLKALGWMRSQGFVPKGAW
jgi:hypothetical protein